MRRIFLLAAAALALVLPATAQAHSPVCHDYVAQDRLLLLPGSSSTIDAPCGAGTYTLTPADPAHGTATASGATLTYTPDPGYHGPDSFTYTATDAGGTSSPASVDVLVDTRPTCDDTTATVPENSSLQLTQDPCHDADGDDYTIFVDDGPFHGTLESGPVYTPAPGFAGVDQIYYYAVDQFGLDSEDGLVTITVTATPAATPTPKPTPTPVRDTTPPSAKLTVARGQKLKQVLAHGLRLTLGSNEAGTASISASVDSATAKKLHLRRQVGAVTTGASAGQVSVTLKLSAKARKALKTARKVRLTVAARVTDLAGNPSSTTLKVTLKR